jgi:GTPase SAR1 family protein
MSSEYQIEPNSDAKSPSKLSSQTDTPMRFLVLGQKGTGKTCLLERYVYGSFGVPSIEPSYYHHWINYKNYRIELVITEANDVDTRSDSFQTANGILLLYDNTNVNSLRKLESWHKTISSIRR